MAVTLMSELRMRDVVVDALQIGFQARLRDYPAVMTSMKVQNEVNHFADYVTYTITAFLSNIHKQNQTNTSLFKYPSTPWEFYKQKYAPAWFLERWPVRYTEEQVVVFQERNFMCPHIALPSSDSYHIKWLMDANDGKYNEPLREW